MRAPRSARARSCEEAGSLATAGRPGEERARKGRSLRLWMQPPALLSLAIDSAVLHIAYITDLSGVPDPILVELFLKTLRAGKLTEKILKLFTATGNEEILIFVQSLNIKQILTPVLPTSKMSWHIEDNEVDIVIAALRSDLTAFMENWRPFFSRFHLIIITDPDMEEDLKIPPGFDHQVFTKSDMAPILGATSINFSGHSCRYFGYLVSRKKYIISIDDDCLPARDNTGTLVDAVAQHIVNLKTPATPFFFNTLYDPFCKGADFVRGYPFSLRNGVECVLSCGLWLNIADYDAPTQVVKPNDRNDRYVDAVMTVPVRAMMPVSGINIGFNRELLGAALFSGLRLAGEGKQRWETMEDIWCGMCTKVVCDHLGLGVKSGLPYVWRGDGVDVGGAMESLKKEWEGVKLMEEVVPFFQSVRLPRTAVTAEDCVIEMAAMVKEQLGPLNPVFASAADAMVEWVKLWKAVGS